MGIGPDSLSNFGTDSKGVFSQLVETHALARPVIGIALVKGTAADYESRAGEYTFGGLSEKWIRGGGTQIHWTNVTSHNFWSVSHIFYFFL